MKRPFKSPIDTWPVDSDVGTGEPTVHSEQTATLWARALSYERAGAIDDALKCCEAALQLEPSCAQVHLTKGSLHVFRNERMTAMECFRRATRLAPDWTAAHHLLASVGGKGFEAPLRAEVAELFDAYADRFDEHLTEELSYSGHEVLPAEIARIIGRSEAQWNIIDLGCGTGLCGPALRPFASQLVGVDVSPKMIACAQKRDIYDQLYVADLVYALATTPHTSVDGLVAADVLGYLGDLAVVFEEGARVLNPRGYFVFSVEASSGSRDYSLKPSRRFAYSERYLRDTIAARGFEIEKMANYALRQEQQQPVSAFVVVTRLV